MSETKEMRVKKRCGTLQEIQFDKILTRVKKIGEEAGISINYSALTMKVIDQLYDQIETSKIDELTSEQCASLSTVHNDYSTLASRIVISNHQKNTSSTFYSVVEKLYNFYDINNNHRPLVSEQLWFFVNNHRDYIEGLIDHNRDYLIDFFGFKTLERAYLFRVNNVIVERIQHMWMRVSIGIHLSKLERVDVKLRHIKETYDMMSNKYFTHATPTLFNAGTTKSQLSSCYLLGMESDSLDGIYNTLSD